MSSHHHKDNDHHQASHSQRYDSVVYHNSMFLKKLSHAPNDKQHHVGWREKLGHFLESKPENIFIFVLIIADLLIICAQLFIVDQYEKCHPPSPPPTHSPQYPYNYNTYHNSSSSEEENHKMKKIGEVLDIASLSILCILAIEMILLLIAFDVKFFKQPLYILDAVVISVTLWIEVHTWKEEHNEEVQGGSFQYGTFIIFFRLWRIVRIVHGVAMSVQEQSEEKIKELEAEVHKLEEEKQKLSTKFDYIKKRYKKLVDAHQEHENEIIPAPRSHNNHNNRIRIDDVYEHTPIKNSPPRHGSQSFSPSPFKSPGAPNNIHKHTIISINDDESLKSVEDISAKTVDGGDSGGGTGGEESLSDSDIEREIAADINTEDQNPSSNQSSNEIRVKGEGLGEIVSVAAEQSREEGEENEDEQRKPLLSSSSNNNSHNIYNITNSNGNSNSNISSDNISNSYNTFDKQELK